MFRAGRHEPAARGRAKNHVEVYAGHLADPGVGGGSGGDTFEKLLGAVERHIKRRAMAGEIEGLPKRVSWHYNFRSPMLKDPTRGIDTYAQDTDPDAVMANIAAQTGLTAKLEKRKVKVLVIKKPE